MPESLASKGVERKTWMDDSNGNSEHGKPTQLKETLNSNKDGSDSIAIEGDFRLENHQQNDLQGGKGEIEINICKENHEDCVDETGEGADSVAENRVQIFQKTPKYQTQKDQMFLQGNNLDETSFRSATAVDNNQTRNFCLDVSPGTAYQLSTEEARPNVAEKLNLESIDSELEAYILEKLSGLQPSFRTLFEPSIVGTSSTVCSENKTGQDAGKSKWKKKIEDLFAKVTNMSAKKQSQSPPQESILYEIDVKGILKMRWEEEMEKNRLKRTRWPRLCICYPSSSITGKHMKNWENQLEEYCSTW
ncbi:hypothetical protein DITRI_Ditri17bG0029200 [Diplodiscus trichospermus]